MAFHSLDHRAPPVAGSSRNIAHQRKHHCKPVTELERRVFSSWSRKLGKFQSPKRFTQRPRNRSIPSRSQSRWRKRSASHSTRWAGPTSSHRLRNTHRLSNPGSNSSSTRSWLVRLSLFSCLLKPSHLSGEGFFCLPHHPKSDLFHCVSSWVHQHPLVSSRSVISRWRWAHPIGLCHGNRAHHLHGNRAHHGHCHRIPWFSDWSHHHRIPHPGLWHGLGHHSLASHPWPWLCGLSHHPLASHSTLVCGRSHRPTLVLKSSRLASLRLKHRLVWTRCRSHLKLILRQLERHQWRHRLCQRSQKTTTRMPSSGLTTISFTDSLWSFPWRCSAGRPCRGRSAPPKACSWVPTAPATPWAAPQRNCPATTGTARSWPPPGTGPVIRWATTICPSGPRAWGKPAGLATSPSRPRAPSPRWGSAGSSNLRMPPSTALGTDWDLLSPRSLWASAIIRSKAPSAVSPSLISERRRCIIDMASTQQSALGS